MPLFARAAAAAGGVWIPVSNNAKMHGWYRFLVRVMCCAFATLAASFLIFILVRDRTQPFSHFTTCFIVDMLEHRVPGNEPPPRHHPPLTLGDFCVDHLQRQVYWQFREDFSHYFKLSDMFLRGPLLEHGQKHAETVLSLGVHSKHPRELSGSRLVEVGLLNQILSHPHRYYLSLEGADHGRTHEIARAPLTMKINTG